MGSVKVETHGFDGINIAVLRQGFMTSLQAGQQPRLMLGVLFERGFHVVPPSFNLVDYFGKFSKDSICMKSKKHVDIFQH